MQGSLISGARMSLYTLTVDLLMRTGSFEKDAGKAARQFE